MTGYVHEMIDKNLDFNGFAWLCARAFGALIMMRDDGMDATVPLEFQPSDYHLKAMAEAQEQMRRWQAMSQDERLAWAREEIAKEAACYRDGLERVRATNAKLKGMLQRVQAWSPPTPDHEGLQRFMVEQLTASTDDESYYRESLARLTTANPLDYLKGRVSKFLDDIAYHEKGHREEVERTNSRNGWLKALAASVGNPPGTPTVVPA